MPALVPKIPGPMARLNHHITLSAPRATRPADRQRREAVTRVLTEPTPHGCGSSGVSRSGQGLFASGARRRATRPGGRPAEPQRLSQPSRGRSGSAPVRDRRGPVPGPALNHGRWSSCRWSQPPRCSIVAVQRRLPAGAGTRSGACTRHHPHPRPDAHRRKAALTLTSGRASATRVGDRAARHRGAPRAPPGSSALSGNLSWLTRVVRVRSVHRSGAEVPAGTTQ